MRERARRRELGLTAAGAADTLALAMSKHPPKPAHVPADAFWEDEVWNAGAKDAAGRRVGTWTSWRPSGEVECVEEWGDGTQRPAKVA